VLSRPKGWGKSPLLAAIACAEALAPVVPAGWDSKGRPVARPWAEIRTPWIQLAAVSEDQTRNAWAPLLEMLREGPAIDEYDVEPLDTFVNLPKGRIEFVTSAATSREGNRPNFAVLDQTEEWKPSNGGVKLAATIRRNLGKTGGASIESPNAYEPGAESVAEGSAEYAVRIAEGRARDDGLLYDHREWPPETEMSDRESLIAGLAVAYGDSAEQAGGWVDLERIAAEVYDPATNPQDARRYYGNQITHASDAWLSQPEWARCLDVTKSVSDREQITLGFDGSRKRRSRASPTPPHSSAAASVTGTSSSSPSGSSRTASPVATGKSPHRKSTQQCEPLSGATASSACTPTQRSGRATSPHGRRRTRTN
jgi:hypothetical protein